MKLYVLSITSFSSFYRIITNHTFTVTQVVVQYKARRTSTLVAFWTGGAQQTNMATVVTQTMV